VHIGEENFFNSDICRNDLNSLLLDSFFYHCGASKEANIFVVIISAEPARAVVLLSQSKLSLRIWSIHLFWGWPGLRFHWLLGGCLLSIQKHW